jgi:hypothetical protein
MVAATRAGRWLLMLRREHSGAAEMRVSHESIYRDVYMTVNGSPMTIGGTATTTTPPAVPPTAKASPVVKAVPPNGF